MNPTTEEEGGIFETLFWDENSPTKFISILESHEQEVSEILTTPNIDVMEKFHTRGTDPTSELCLRDFENEIYKEHTPMMLGIDALKTIYSQNNPVFTTLRNIGTATINSNQAAKELFISRAA